MKNRHIRQYLFTYIISFDPKAEKQTFALYSQMKEIIELDLDLSYRSCFSNSSFGY